MPIKILWTSQTSRGGSHEQSNMNIDTKSPSSIFFQNLQLIKWWPTKKTQGATTITHHEQWRDRWHGCTRWTVGSSLAASAVPMSSPPPPELAVWPSWVNVNVKWKPWSSASMFFFWKWIQWICENYKFATNDPFLSSDFMLYRWNSPSGSSCPPSRMCGWRSWTFWDLESSMLRKTSKKKYGTHNINTSTIQRPRSV